jgi:hypothetical protein
MLKSIVTLEVSQVVPSDDEPDAKYYNSYFAELIRNSSHYRKLLFNVLALYAPDPPTFRALALSCRAGRDVCHEFNALVRYAFRRVVVANSIIGSFLPNGNADGIFWGRLRREMESDSLYKNGNLQYYLVRFTTNQQTTYTQCNFKAHLSVVGNILIKTFRTIICFCNIKKDTTANAVRCINCADFCLFYTVLADGRAFVLHKKFNGKLVGYISPTAEGVARVKCVRCKLRTLVHFEKLGKRGQSGAQYNGLARLTWPDWCEERFQPWE